MIHKISNRNNRLHTLAVLLAKVYIFHMNMLNVAISQINFNKNVINHHTSSTSILNILLCSYLFIVKTSYWDVSFNEANQ